MALNPAQAVDQAHSLLDWHNGERDRLERIYSYWRGRQRFLWLPEGTPLEVRRFAEMSRVNVLKLIVDASAQSMYVEGFKTPRSDVNEDVWQVWQNNRLDSRQIELHRGAHAFGASYQSVLPGDPVPVVRPSSPRKMTAVYGEDEDWPMWALEKRRTDRGQLYRLYDQEAVYWLGRESDHDQLEFIQQDFHDAGVVPVVRFRDQGEIDGEVLGQVEPHIPLQDQINLTTFVLLVAQHYGAHRQRYIIGWLADSEQQLLKTSAQRVWNFEDDPSDIKVGEFEQTDLDGYIKNREETVRLLATLSQTPVHEMLGQMANLAAEALAAARDSHYRKMEEHRTIAGEAHEQTLSLAGAFMGAPPAPDAWVRWRDMETRSLAQVADALGKLAQSLHIPPRALWERAGDALGASQQEIDDWVRLAEEGDPLVQLERDWERQAGNFV